MDARRHSFLVQTPIFRLHPIPTSGNSRCNHPHIAWRAIADVHRPMSLFATAINVSRRRSTARRFGIGDQASIRCIADMRAGLPHDVHRAGQQLRSQSTACGSPARSSSLCAFSTTLSPSALDVAVIFDAQLVVKCGHVLHDDTKMLPRAAIAVMFAQMQYRSVTRDLCVQR